MKIKYTIWGVLAGTAGLILTSCEEKGLLVSSNDTAYLRFADGSYEKSVIYWK